MVIGLRTQRSRHRGRPDALLGGNRADPHVDGDTSGDMIQGDCRGAPLLVAVEPEELAVASEREDPVDPSGDHVIDHPPQGTFIHPLVAVHRGDDGGDHPTNKTRLHGRSLSAHQAGTLVVEFPARNQILHGHGVVARAQSFFQI